MRWKNEMTTMIKESEREEERREERRARRGIGR
jgi:hypothetical protein